MWRISSRFKIPFSQRKTYLSQFVDNFLKFEETFEMWPALCKFSILFSTGKLRLGHIFSLCTLDSKLGFWLLVLGCNFRFFPIYIEIKKLGFFEWRSRFFLILPNSWNRLKIRTLNIKLDCTSKFFLIHELVWNWDFIKIFEVSLFSYFVWLWGLSFRYGLCDGGGVWGGGGGGERQCSYLCNSFMAV